MIEPILPALPYLKHVFVLGGDARGHSDFSEVFSGQSEVFKVGEESTADTCCDDVAFWLYSSGSTGMPKGVPHVQTSLTETARLYGQGVLGMQQNDVVFSAAKLFFAYGLGNALSFPMLAGATTILWSARPTPETVFATLEEHQPHYLFRRANVVCCDVVLF